MLLEEEAYMGTDHVDKSAFTNTINARNNTCPRLLIIQYRRNMDLSIIHNTIQGSTKNNVFFGSLEQCCSFKPVRERKQVPPTTEGGF